MVYDMMHAAALSMSTLDTPTLGRVCKLPKLFPSSSGAAPGTLVDSKQRGMLVCSVLLSILCRGREHCFNHCIMYYYYTI